MTIPLWGILILIAIWAGLILCIILLKAYHNEHSSDIYYDLDLIFNTTILNLIIAMILATATIILVFVTGNYVHQSAIMAQETAKMAQSTQLVADYNNFRWRYELMPLFLPTKKPNLEGGDKELNFHLANYGGLGLFVTIEIVDFNHTEYYPKQGPHADFRIPIRNPIRKMNEIKANQQSSDSIRVTINISFQDKETRKYKQTIRYSFSENDWSFAFDKSCLPVEIKNCL